MWITTILPSDGLPIEVKVLPLYSLLSIGPKDPGVFTYKVKTLLGEILEQPYNLLARLENPPIEPTLDSDAWELTEWERFQAAIARNKEQFDCAYERGLNIARHVIDNCLKSEDRDRITNPADYDHIYAVGVAKEINRDEVRRQLADFFRGDFRQPASIGRTGEIQPGRGGHRDRLSDLSGMGDTAKDQPEDEHSGILRDTVSGADPDVPGNQNRRVARQPRNRKKAARKAPVTPTLVASIILYQWREAQGIGFERWPELGLWQACYRKLERELQEHYAKAEMLNTQLRLGQLAMKRIMTEAETATVDRQKELLKEAKKLQSQMRKIKKELDAGII